MREQAAPLRTPKGVCEAALESGWNVLTAATMCVSNAGRLAIVCVYFAVRIGQPLSVHRGASSKNTAKATISTLLLRQHTQPFSTPTKNTRGATYD
jgi:hypothetical protein